MLLDFGAARITLSDEPMKLKPMYTAGFAAPEQYQFEPGSSGPGATSTPWAPRSTPASRARRRRPPTRAMEKDRLIPLRTLARETYSDELYSIVDACLELDHLKRPQTAFELQKLLMIEPQGAGRKGFFDTINKPLSKLFSK